MTKNDVEKAFYKEKPEAKVVVKTSTIWGYVTECSLGTFGFDVPIADMGEALFKDTEPAQLLIRWLSGGFTPEEMEQIKSKE